MEKQKVDININGDNEEVNTNQDKNIPEESDTKVYNNKLDAFIALHPRLSMTLGLTTGVLVTAFAGYGVFKVVRKAAAKTTKHAIHHAVEHIPERVVEQIPEKTEEVASDVIAEAAKDTVEAVAEA